MIEKIRAQKWKEILEVIVKSQKSEKNCPCRSQYAIVAGKKYTYSEQAKIGEGRQLLTKEIVEISTATLEAIKAGDQISGEKNAQNLKEIKEITDYTQQLIEMHEAKSKPLLRQVALIVSFLASFILVGIPFFVRLRRVNQEMKCLREDLHQLKRIQEEIALKDAAKELFHVLKNNILSHPLMTDEILNAEMQKMMEREFQKIKSAANPLIVPIFQVDMERNALMKRTDGNIKDEKPQPPLGISNRLKEGLKLIRQMIKTEEDKKWEALLQLAMGQTFFNVILGDIIPLFIQAATTHTVNDVLYLELKKADPLVICLTPMRDDKGNIEKLKMTIEAQGYHISVNPLAGHGKAYKAPVIPQAMQVNAECFLTLGEKGAPILSDFKRSFTTAAI